MSRLRNVNVRYWHLTDMALIEAVQFDCTLFAPATYGELAEKSYFSFDSVHVSA